MGRDRRVVPAPDYPPDDEIGTGARDQAAIGRMVAVPASSWLTAMISALFAVFPLVVVGIVVVALVFGGPWLLLSAMIRKSDRGRR